MAKAVLIVRGPLGVAGSPDITVVRNPVAEVVAQNQEMPSSLNADDLLFKPPGGSKEISLKAFKEGLKVKEGS